MNKVDFDFQIEGALEGVEGDNRKILEERLREIDHELLVTERIQQLAVPVVSHIIKNIIRTENEHSLINKTSRMVTPEKMMEVLNVDEIITYLRGFCYEVIPPAENHLWCIDAQAELTLLFCNNYFYMLFEQVVHDTQNDKPEQKS